MPGKCPECGVPSGLRHIPGCHFGPNYEVDTSGYFPKSVCPECDGWYGKHKVTCSKHIAPEVAETFGPIEQILDERGKRYGIFADHARITQALKSILHAEVQRDHMRDDQWEAVDMICHKLGRIINGDPNYVDSWDDIAGYAKLVGDRLRDADSKA